MTLRAVERLVCQVTSSRCRAEESRFTGQAVRTMPLHVHLTNNTGRFFIRDLVHVNLN